MKKLLFILLLVFTLTETRIVTTYAVDNEYETGWYAITSYTTRSTIYKNEGTKEFNFSMHNSTKSSKTISIKSSNTDVIRVTSDSSALPVTDGYTYTFRCKPLKAGVSVVTVQVGEEKVDLVIFVHDTNSGDSIKSITQPEYNKIKITWKKYDGCSGYYIKRSVPDKYDYKIIKSIKGDDVTSAVFVSNEWNKAYDYIVVPYIEIDGYKEENYSYSSKKFVLSKKSTQLTSIKKLTATSVKISWKKDTKSKGYKVYRATSPNGAYKCIYTTKDKNKTSYTNRISRGITYYYKIRTIYPEFISDYSDTLSKILPISRKTINKRINITNNFFEGSQYGGNWAGKDDAYYYVASGRLHMVIPETNAIKIYTLNSSFKKTGTKTIKIKYDMWGGFYQGTDGNFYVAVGYDNRAKESKTKVVIKVIKYNKNWKRIKTANIKGGVSNSFQGITCPFDAGNCSMDMQGNTLYIHTCREMFVHSDGLNHQSNISFAVNTKTMKAVATGDSYVSHSFNQYAKFYSGDLYLLDHGDAYPRSICMSIIKNYGKKGEESSEYNIFKIRGQSGDNFTGATVGGMEVGAKNVMVCGTAHPHYSKIKGISGSKWEYAKNVYLIMVNKETGKKTLKWITNYNPKTSKVVVGDTRMVKLDDNRFGIMYTTTSGKTKRLNYVVVNNEGKKIYSKRYANMSFKGGSQPVLYKGRIVWLGTEEREKKVEEIYGNYIYTYTTTVSTDKIYGIPALVK